MNIAWDQTVLAQPVEQSAWKVLSCTQCGMFLKAEPGSHFLFVRLFICNSIPRQSGFSTVLGGSSLCCPLLYASSRGMIFHTNETFISYFLMHSSLWLISQIQQVLMEALLNTLTMWLSTNEGSSTFASDLWGPFSSAAMWSFSVFLP